MFTLLRKIRKSIVGSGSIFKATSPTARYLLYALGEIVLVVLGILIALQVNNWYAHKKNMLLEQSFLERLKTDLVVDTTYLNERIQHSEIVKEQNYSFVHKAYENLNPNRNLNDYISIPMFSSEDLTMQNSTYMELLNTGKIDLIRNENLKIHIIELYHNYESVDKKMQEINEFTTDLWQEWNKKVVNIKYREYVSDLFDQTNMFNSNERKWFNDPKSFEFRLTENTIAWYYAKHKIFIDHFNSLLDDAETVLDLINEELNKLQ